MKYTGLIAALLIVTSACHAGDIAANEWGANRQKELNTPDLRTQTQHLLEKLLPDADLVTPNVREGYFVDLDKEAELELVATVD